MPTLFLIPVPIADAAIHTLPAHTIGVAQDVDFYIAERAKTARHFLKAIGLKRPIQEIEVTEIDEKDPSVAENALKLALANGKDVGLLSEAGCPGVADPGANVVALAHRLGMSVKPLVGPSSLLLALMASGMNGQQFTFHGYLSPKRPELADDLKRLELLAEKNKQTQLFIETPYRSQMVLEVALSALRPDTQFAVAQDITGPGEFIRSLTVQQWKKTPPAPLVKAPAVFLIFRK
jgi:16S rRNA (cytidine1402-2'-O)-methyltransferase